VVDAWAARTDVQIAAIVTDLTVILVVNFLAFTFRFGEARVFAGDSRDCFPLDHCVSFRASREKDDS
jgi:hypothetical protein